MPNTSTYLIIGAGIAGLTAATSIRNLDKKSSITLINGEPYPPYKRTNLSKFFAVGFLAEDFTLATEEDLQKFYNIALVQDTVRQIDYNNRLAIADKGCYSYNYLILATGARYELPAGLQHPKLKFYHDKQETFALQDQLRDLQNIAVLGAGVQGMETCYELLKLGKQVSLIHPYGAPLTRLKSPYISSYLKQDLQQRRVQCHWNQHITQFTDSMLDSFDLVICCFGTKPVKTLFPTNAKLQENLLIAPNTFACGDNLEYQDGGSTNRCTLWHEAMDLGQLAGLNAARLSQGMSSNELEKLQRKPYRIKIEVADKVLFLAPPIKSDSYRDRHWQHNGNYYQFFLDNRGKLNGASLLCDDRELLKPLQQAIWDQLDSQQACEFLGIPENTEFSGNFTS